MKGYILNLGKSSGINVPYIFSTNSGNRHLIAFGMSGYGKSTLLSTLEKQLVAYGIKILEIDYSDSSIDKTMLSKYSRIININTNIVCSPLSRRCDVYGIKEGNIDYARRISNIISGALRLPSKQKAVLYSAVKKHLDNMNKFLLKIFVQS